ncbi:unnamed protein product [Cunninghamella blakesleeana]
MVIYKNLQNTHCTNKSSLTIVIKVGTSSICDEKTHYPLLGTLSRIVETIVKLKEANHRVVLVTSAAVGTGLRRLNLQERPTRQSLVQAIAAVGQGRLMSLYDDLFGRFNQTIAQILLTKKDLANRTQYLNAVKCLEELLDLDVVPIVNENDTISFSEIKFGDNDTLSAITASMIKADYLFLMTDVDCLYTDNPRTNPNAKPITVCEDIDALKQEVNVNSGGSKLGTGGFKTKITAAEIATAAGVTTVITRSVPERILHIISDDYDNSNNNNNHGNNPMIKPLYTRFVAKPNPLIDHKWWILHGLHTSGTLFIDEKGAKNLLCVDFVTSLPSPPSSSKSSSDNHQDRHYTASSLDRPKSKNDQYQFVINQGIANNSLFIQSVIKVDGDFVEGQAVRIVVDHPSENGSKLVSIAKGIINYSSAEINRIIHAREKNMVELLGYMNQSCVIFKDNMAISI